MFASQGLRDRPERKTAPHGVQPSEAVNATPSPRNNTVDAIRNLIECQDGLTIRPPRLPDLGAALLDPRALGATLSYRYDTDKSRDVLTISRGSAEPRHVFEGDEDWLCCRLEELGFSRVSPKRLRRAFAYLPHTSEHEANRRHWVRA